MARPALLIMAAGLGHRFGGLKQVEPVGPQGELVIEYSIYDALRAGFERVVFLIRPEMLELFREKVGRRVERAVAVEYAFQRLDDLPAGFCVPPGRAKPWGTAHAVWSCRAAIQQPFAAINADDFYGRETFATLGTHLANLPQSVGRLHGCMASFVLENTLSEHGSVARGVCQVSPQGRLLSVQEHLHIQRRMGAVMTSPDGQSWAPLAPATPVSMNIWGFGPDIFAALGQQFPLFLRQAPTLEQAEFFLPNVVGALIAIGRLEVDVLPTAAHWFGVTYPDDLPLVRQRIAGLVQAGEYPPALWEQPAIAPS
jgi:hypothetical protein